MNKNELIVLGLLNEKPAYGYQLRNIIKEKRLDKWGISKQPSIYSTLNKLEREGKIIGRKEQHGNMPPSIIYSLTDKGKKSLKQNVEEALASKSKPVNPSIIGIAFITGTTKQKAIQILRDNLDYLNQQVDLINDKSEEIKNQNLGFNWQFLIDFAKDIRPVVKKSMEKLIKKIEETDESYFYQENNGEEK
ncbi:MAG: PadR family transcriptional regulator [Candidatus Cloacimonadota bacterium]|nr:PadR family transcriptional regulator [Candidatus Cloacimonadota bacterium]